MRSPRGGMFPVPDIGNKPYTRLFFFDAGCMLHMEYVYLAAHKILSSGASTSRALRHTRIGNLRSGATMLFLYVVRRSLELCIS